MPAGAVGKVAACVKCGIKIKISEKNTVAPGVPSPPATAPKEPEERPRRKEQRKGTAPAPVARDSEHITKAFLEKGLVDEASLALARLIQQDLPKNTWEILIDTGQVSQEDFHALMSEQKGVARIDLQNYNIPNDVVEFVPEDIVRRGILFPVDKLGKLLTLGMACPIDAEIVDEVQERTGLKVKTMLCDLADLRKTIKVFYPPDRLHVSYDDTFGKEMVREFATTIENIEVAQRVFDLGLLPPAGPAAGGVKELAAQSEPDIRAVAEVLALDPTSAALILSVSNSAAYGFSKRVDNIGMAVTLMGVDAANTVLSAVEPKDYQQQFADFDYADFVRRSRFCSQAAHAIGDAAGSMRAVTAQAAGLLHEIGRLVLLTALPTSYATVTKGKVGEDLVAVEERTYRMNYTEAGYMAARKWNLPSGITEPIRFHRSPEKATRSREVVSIVALASLMTEARDSGEEAFPEDTTPLLQNLKLNREQVENVYRQLTAGE